MELIVVVILMYMVHIIEPTSSDHVYCLTEKICTVHA